MDGKIGRFGVIAERVCPIVAPAGLFVANIFLFGPFTIYRGNASEFAIPFVSILAYFVLPAVVLLMVLCGVGLVLGEKMWGRYVAILFGIAVLTWMQGNILVWQYGPLDGRGIDWAREGWRGWMDGTLWGMVIILCYWFHKSIQKVTTFVSGVLVCLQAVPLIVFSFGQSEIRVPRVAAREALPKSIYEFSSTQNVIHVILDAFQSDVFREIVEEDFGHYGKALDGFTFFSGATGVFPTTYMSIPAILSGQVYKNEMPMPEFVRKTLSGPTIPNVLYENGYGVDLVHSLNLYCHGRFSSCLLIPTPYLGTRGDYERQKAALMLDVVLFRHVPHFVKRIVYNNQSWLVQRLVSDGSWGLAYFSQQMFLRDMVDNIFLGRHTPVYKFIHLITTHPPFVVDRNCDYAGQVVPHMRENFKIQAKCALDQIVRFLEKLRTLEIYDNALIILESDTGMGMPVNVPETANGSVRNQLVDVPIGTALALMAIKPPFSHGTLKTSNVQVSLSDTAATVADILGVDEEFAGRSAFKVGPDEKRERIFHNHRWRRENWQADFFERLDQYVIRGSVFDGQSWELTRHWLGPDVSFQTSKIDFGTREGSRFLLKGWGGDGQTAEEGHTVHFNWALGRSAAVTLILPERKALQLTAKVKTLPFPKPQIVTIEVDGKQIGNWRLSNRWKWEEHSVIVPPEKNRPKVSVVKFVFSDYLDRPEGRETRPLAVLFESLTVREVDEKGQAHGS